MVWQFNGCTKISALILLILLLILPLGGQSKEDRKLLRKYETQLGAKTTSLDSIRVALQKSRERFVQLGKEVGNNVKRLEAMEQSLALSQEYLASMGGRRDSVEKRIVRLSDSLQLNNKNLTKIRTVMKKRLRFLYKTGKPNIMETILTTGNILESLYKMRYFDELNNYDRMLLEKIDSTQHRIVQQKKSLEAEKLELISLKKQKEEESVTLLAEHKKRKKLLEDITNEKTAYEAAIKNLEKSQNELNSIVSVLKKKREQTRRKIGDKQTVKFAKLKGKLAWPVRGKVSQKFGKIVHPVYHTVTMNNGIDIRAGKGKVVSAVAEGVVEYIGFMHGYGRFVIINHYNNYLTVYAHLQRSDVTKDDFVLAGSPIGLVGESGSLDGVKLHFQIRHGGEVLNPSEWLKK